MNNNLMSVKQTLKCSLNMPLKWQEDYNGRDKDNRNNLPEYAPVSIYTVDEYPTCPNNWMHGSDISSSYFGGLKEDWAIWLDFNECFNHTYDVAVVLSVQGINPVTGQTMIGDNPLRLEQYHKICPIHSVDFKQDYFCEECGFKWPGQNYLSTTGTPFGMFWLDGFRTSDGNVRQYIITAEKMRGVAAQVMDSPEKRVFAIGMAFYLSKKKKPEQPKFKKKRIKKYKSSDSSYNSSITWTQPSFFSPMHSGLNRNMSSSSSTISSSCSRKNVNPDVIDSRYDRSVYQLGPNLTESQLAEIDAAVAAGKNVERFYTLNKNAFKQNLIIEEGGIVEPVIPVKKLEVGAGALVNQLVYDDPKNIKYWEEKPAGMIYINYCDEITLKKILNNGKRADKKDGFMQGIQVG